ncbi:MAG: alpha-L-rhamnosidase [Spirochaetales bacterium]|nr:alpha-L-rhamnosidase [Spirochaetales bacterium]
MDAKYTVVPKRLVQTERAPASTLLLDDQSLFIDFGSAAFGTLTVPIEADSRSDSLVVHLGEKLNTDGRIDRDPPGSIRYRRIAQQLRGTGGPIRVVIPPDERNTRDAAILMPDYIGEVYPFRYAEIEDAAHIDAAAARQICVHYPFDDTASSFHSSDETLNAVWDLCKYSIKATSFCGVYVDGDRERIPYEADAYINQLCHYSVDDEYGMARYTHEYLLQHPTWPTEWQLHSVMMAWQDYMYTGETQSLELFYDDLCVKTLVELARDDGLISTESPLCSRDFEERLHFYGPRYAFDHGLRDLVDWPPGSFTNGGIGERDNHEMVPVNTVVNCFHYHALVLMSRIANVFQRKEDERRFNKQADLVRSAINRLLFDFQIGVYVDGEDSSHASLHSNMVVLAFGVVPDNRRRTVVDFVKSRGMACSVYAAQYLLEALYENDEDGHALDLMTAKHDRGWWNMIQAGSTVTLEAWDWKYKNNLDWNHAWGAVPANIIPRYLMGIRPLKPGFSKVLIQPRPGQLEKGRVKFPTIRGAVQVDFKSKPGTAFLLEVTIPAGMTAAIDLPFPGGDDSRVLVDGIALDRRISGRFARIDNVQEGYHTFERKSQT